MTLLESAAAAGVPVPAYDRSRVAAGIVHVGVGGFARAHLAEYCDRLLAAGERAWGICGVGTQPGDRGLSEVLLAQDGLYTLVVKHPDGRLEPRVVGSLVSYLYAPDDPEAVVEQMAAATTRIVSLTITEGGYLVDPTSRRFTPQAQPAVLLDLQPGAAPSTVFALVVEALARRRARGLPPFTVLSCDNVQRNGDVAREAFAGFAALRDAELGDWVRGHVAFPSSMVDRITPATTDEDRAALAERGVPDGWPVVCEAFQQWVLEDAFGLGRPPLETVGVQLVDDVHPYELMKLRLLNAGHQALGYLGHLAGHRTTDAACADPLLAAFLRAYLEREATPALPPVPGIDLADYRRTLLERFANPYVRDTLARLCAESSDRIPTFLLPVVRAQRAAGGEFACSALVVAAWARYAEGVDERGEPIRLVDRLLETVHAAAEHSRQDPAAFLRDTGVFGDLATDAAFVEAFTRSLAALRRQGVRATVQELLDGTGPR